MFRQVHWQQLEARARLEVAKQRLRQSEELLVQQTLQTGEAAREKRIRRQWRKTAAAAAAAEAALGLRASTSCTVAGVALNARQVHQAALKSMLRHDGHDQHCWMDDTAVLLSFSPNTQVPFSCPAAGVRVKTG